MATIKPKADESSRPNWLDEVRQAAKLNYLRGIREQEEKAEIAEAARAGTLDELIDKQSASVKQKQANKKGKKICQR